MLVSFCLVAGLLFCVRMFDCLICYCCFGFRACVGVGFIFSCVGLVFVCLYWCCVGFFFSGVVETWVDLLSRGVVCFGLLLAVLVLG